MKSAFWFLIFLIIVNHSSIKAQTDETKKEITIFMCGNSIMADKPFNDGNPEKGWGQIFPLYFKQGIKIENMLLMEEALKVLLMKDDGIQLLIKLKLVIM